jgi:hypothetical protein
MTHRLIILRHHLTTLIILHQILQLNTDGHFFLNPSLGQRFDDAMANSTVTLGISLYLLLNFPLLRDNRRAIGLLLDMDLILNTCPLAAGPTLPAVSPLPQLGLQLLYLLRLLLDFDVPRADSCVKMALFVQVVLYLRL